MTTPTIFDRIEAGEYDNHPPEMANPFRDADGPESEERLASCRRSEAAFVLEQARLDALFVRDILLHLGVCETEHDDPFLKALVAFAWDGIATDDDADYVREIEHFLPLYRLHRRLINS